jgi:ectoine hydroxylase-related dioxygenase (phytanoyl-CoA dioxygenase family)
MRINIDSGKAIDDFTAENGATRVVPGSHLWDSKRRPTLEESIPMVGKSGTVVYVSITY